MTNSSYKKLLYFVLVFVLFISLFLFHDKGLADTKMDLSGMTLTALPNANKANAIDGNLVTSWNGTNAGDFWQIDLGSTISSIYAKIWGGDSGVPIENIQYSTNGVDWYIAPPVANGGSNSPCDINAWRQSTTINARYLKWTAGAPFPHGICEFEVYSTGSSPTPSPPTPTPSSSGTSTPTPSGSITTTPTITGSGDPPSIECPNPPCYQDPDDPIYPPSDNFNIILEVPNGGEKWEIGTKHKIKWKFIDTEKKMKKFALFLSRDGGRNFQQVIEQGIEVEKTEHEWNIPDDKAYITDEAKVLVAAYGDSIDRPLINDKSDNNFKIYAKDEEYFGIDISNLPLATLVFILLGLGSLAVFWPQIVNFFLNSFITSLLNRLSLLTAPTIGNKKGTGVVYDSYNKKPVQKAMVRIFNAENNKQLEGLVTNQKGEFSFIIPNGKYYLTAVATNYDFPSKNNDKNESNIFKPGLSDGTYANLYFGENILINKEGSSSDRYALNINIPLDKTSAYNLEAKMLKVLRIIGNILVKIKWPTILIGTALSIYAIISNFSFINYIICDLYLALILYELYRLFSKSRPYGVIFSYDKKPVDLAVIRFNQNNKIVATSISGNDGKFTAAVNPGNYYLATKKIGFNSDVRNITVKSSRRLEELNIALTKTL